MPRSKKTSIRYYTTKANPCQIGLGGSAAAGASPDGLASPRGTAARPGRTGDRSGTLHGESRALRACLLLGLLLGGSAVLLAVTLWADNALNRGVAWGEDLPRIVHADVPPLGVNLFLDREPDEADIRRSLEAARAMGARWGKQLFPWNQIEPEAKGDFWDERYGQSTWEHYDLIVRLAQEAGLELIVRLDYPPDWARAQALSRPALQEALREDPDRKISGPPDRLEDYGDFVYAVVSRYRGQVRYIQIWNEPNLANEWNWAPIDPERFVELLCLGYARAKEADPEVVVLFPSLAPNDGKDPRHMSDLEFLQRVYQAGGADCFDVMSAQLYGLGQPPTERSPLGFDQEHLRLITRTDVSRVVLLREVMERYGDEGKAIWVGELGWNAPPPDWGGRPSPWGRPVDEESKGRYIVAALDRSLKEWPWMGVQNLWFLHWDGPPPKPDDPTVFFALLKYDFTPLPAYEAVRAWAAAPPLGSGYHDLRSLDREEVSFYGTRLDLLLPATADPDRVQVLVDGSPVSLRYWRAEGEEARYIAADDLADGRHTLRVEGPAGLVRGGYVIREQPWPWLFPLLAALLSVALVGVLALLLLRLPAGLADLGDLLGRGVERFSALSERLQAGVVLGGLGGCLAAFYLLGRLPDPLALLAAGLLFLLLILLALLRPDLSLAVSVLVLPLYPRPPEFAGRRFSLFELTTLALLLAVGLRLLRAGSPRTWLSRFRPGLLLPALLFVAVCAGSLFWATDHSFVTERGVRLLHISLREFRVTVVEPFLLYPLLVLVLGGGPVSAAVGSPLRRQQIAARQRRWERAWRVVDALVLGGALVSLVGIVQVFSPTQHAEVAEGVRRASSVYGTFSPNTLALYLGRVLAIVIAGGVFLPWGRRKRLYLLACLLVGGCFFLTYSRGGYLALGVVLLFYGLFYSRPLLWLELIGGGGVVLLALLTGAGDRLLALDTFRNRLTMWRNAWDLLQGHLGEGLGLDAFYHHYRRRYPALEAYWTPHNLVLEFWTRLGAVGLAAGLWLYGAVLTRLGRLCRSEDGAVRVLALGLLGSVVYALAHGLLDGTFFAPDWAATFWLAVGLAEVLR